MGEVEYRWFVGVDWATEAHQVCVVDRQGVVLKEREVEHSATGLAEFLQWIERLSGGALDAVAVGIEVPRGAVVETLLERGIAVFAINPKQSDRFRDRFSPAGAKDDSRDALVIADSLRTDMHCFRKLDVDDPATIEIRETVRIHDELRNEEGRLRNQLREQLLRYMPQMLKLSPAAGDPWLWDVLEIAPTPERAKTLRRDRIDRILRKRRVRSVLPNDVLAQFRAPPLRLAPGTIEAAGHHVELLIPRLQLVHEQLKTCNRRLTQLLGTAERSKNGAETETDEHRPQHRDAEILASSPGAGTIVVATVLAEASQPIRDRDLTTLRALTGIAPITRQSGKRRVVIMRQACNGRLRNACYHWARIAVQHDPPSHVLYAQLRGRGMTHGRALRGVMDRLLTVAVAMLRNGTLYDPALRRGTQIKQQTARSKEDAA
jgi:transposase